MKETNFLKLGSSSTLWKFQDYPAIQILREINFANFWSSKNAIFEFLEALDFYSFSFWYISTLKNSRKSIKWKISAFEIVKMADFETIDSPILISRKI